LIWWTSGHAKDGRRVARELYGARGFVLHHNTDRLGPRGAD
jgi:hypothetical protein